MPPKKAHPRTRSETSRNDSASERSLFNLADPEWMMDGRKDPANAEKRKEAARRAAETRERKKAMQPQQIPGSFPTHNAASKAELPTASRADSPTLTMEITPPAAMLAVPTLSFEMIQGGYEGPHALLQPAVIDREPHELIHPRPYLTDGGDCMNTCYATTSPPTFNGK
jgi:hypothetical protein